MNHTSKDISLSLALFGIAILGYLVKYFLNALLASHMTPELYGDFAVALRVLTIVSGIALLGTNISSKRFLSKYLNMHKDHQAKDYVAWNLHVIRYTFFVCLALGLVLGLLNMFLRRYDIHNVDELHLAVYMLWVSPFFAFSLLFTSFLLCNRNVVLAQFFANFAKYSLMFVFFGVSIYFLDIPIYSGSIVGIMLGAFLVLAVIEALFVNRFFSNTMPLAKAIEKPQKTKDKWFKVAVRLIANNIIFLLMCTADLIIIEIISPREQAVGFYAAALTISSVLQIIPRGVYTVVKPYIADSLYDEKKLAILQKRFNHSNIVFFILTAVIMLSIIGFAKPLLATFGPAYTEAVTALIILSVGRFFSLMCQSSILIMAYGDHEKMMMSVSFIEFVLLVISASVMTYYFGITGTAIATACVMTLKSITYITFVKLKHKLKPLSLI
tara:strand:- start:25533 stop:26852 length:1320 start_codon:yes stop_codon:yes gene_type:complete